MTENIEDEYITFMTAKYNKKDPTTNEYMKKSTHTLMGPLHPTKQYRGVFSITGKEYDKFLKLYKKVHGKFPLHIVERHNETGLKVGPLIIDIDYKIKTQTRQYKLKHIENIIEICNKYIKKYININKFKAYVLEKENPSLDKNDLYKDGFHIFYDIPLCYNKRKFLFDKLKLQIENDDVFEDIEHCSKYDTIVDESVLIDNGILMYGSIKEGKKPYVLTHVYDENCCFENIEDYEFDELVDIFSLRRYTDDDDIEFVEKYKDDEEKIKNMVHAKKETKSTKKNNNNENKIEKNTDDTTININGLSKTDLEIYNLVDLLGIERSRDYNSWIRVCWTLHGLSKKNHFNNMAYYNFFIMFSKKASDAFSEDGCKKAWYDANKEKTSFTMSSLKMWAREDNPEGYKKFYYDKICGAMLKLESINDSSIAEIIKEIYGDYYKCTSIKNNVWYEFQRHRWVQVDNAYTLMEKIAIELTYEFIDIIKKFMGNQPQDQKQTKLDEVYKKISELNSLVKKLGSYDYRNKLIKASALKLYDPRFEELLDSNPYLIGFENGIYDLRTHKFRDGVPDDFISLSTNYEYVEYTEDDTIYKHIMNFIQKIQPEYNMREYVLRLFASMICGGNIDQQFRIFTGSGSNGKSKIIDLFHEALGGYSGSLPSEILTLRNNNPNGASPFLADKRGKRFLAIQEPENDATIQVGKMKELTGGDPVSVRKNYGDPFTYKPQFKMILICNDLPKIPSTDGGTWRRIRVAQFTSKFVSKNLVDETKHHYLMDKSINDEKLKNWAPCFMWMLINIYFPKYNKPEEENGGLQETDEVKKFSLQYLIENDAIGEFISETVVITNDENDTESLQQFYRQFREWHKGNRNQPTKFDKNHIEKYLKENKKLKIDKTKGLIFGVKCKWEDD